MTDSSVLNQAMTVNVAGTEWRVRRVAIPITSILLSQPRHMLSAESSLSYARDRAQPRARLCFGDIEDAACTFEATTYDEQTDYDVLKQCGLLPEPSSGPVLDKARTVMYTNPFVGSYNPESLWGCSSGGSGASSDTMGHTVSVIPLEVCDGRLQVELVDMHVKNRETNGVGEILFRLHPEVDPGTVPDDTYASVDGAKVVTRQLKQLSYAETIANRNMQVRLFTPVQESMKISRVHAFQLAYRLNRVAQNTEAVSPIELMKAGAMVLNRLHSGSRPEADEVPETNRVVPNARTLSRRVTLQEQLASPFLSARCSADGGSRLSQPISEAFVWRIFEVLASRASPPAEVDAPAASACVATFVEAAISGRHLLDIDSTSGGNSETSTPYGLSEERLQFLAEFRAACSALDTGDDDGRTASGRLKDGSEADPVGIHTDCCPQGQVVEEAVKLLLAVDGGSADLGRNDGVVGSSFTKQEATNVLSLTAVLLSKPASQALWTFAHRFHPAAANVAFEHDTLLGSSSRQNRGLGKKSAKDFESFVTLSILLSLSICLQSNEEERSVSFRKGWPRQAFKLASSFCNLFMELDKMFATPTSSEQRTTRSGRAVGGDNSDVSRVVRMILDLLEDTRALESESGCMPLTVSDSGDSTGAPSRPAELQSSILAIDCLWDSLWQQVRKTPSQDHMARAVEAVVSQLQVLPPSSSPATSVPTCPPAAVQSAADDPCTTPAERDSRATPAASSGIVPAAKSIPTSASGPPTTTADGKTQGNDDKSDGGGERTADDTAGDTGKQDEDSGTETLDVTNMTGNVPPPSRGLGMRRRTAASGSTRITPGIGATWSWRKGSKRKSNRARGTASTGRIDRATRSAVTNRRLLGVALQRSVPPQPSAAQSAADAERGGAGVAVAADKASGANTGVGVISCIPEEEEKLGRLMGARAGHLVTSEREASGACALLRTTGSVVIEAIPLDCVFVDGEEEGENGFSLATISKAVRIRARRFSSLALAVCHAAVAGLGGNEMRTASESGASGREKGNPQSKVYGEGKIDVSFCCERSKQRFFTTGSGTMEASDGDPAAQFSLRVQLRPDGVYAAGASAEGGDGDGCLDWVRLLEPSATSPMDLQRVGSPKLRSVMTHTDAYNTICPHFTGSMLFLSAYTSTFLGAFMTGEEKVGGQAGQASVDGGTELTVQRARIRILLPRHVCEEPPTWDVLESMFSQDHYSFNPLHVADGADNAHGASRSPRASHADSEPRVGVLACPPHTHSDRAKRKESSHSFSRFTVYGNYFRGWSIGNGLGDGELASPRVDQEEDLAHPVSTVGHVSPWDLIKVMADGRKLSPSVFQKTLAQNEKNKAEDNQQAIEAAMRILQLGDNEKTIVRAFSRTGNVDRTEGEDILALRPGDLGILRQNIPDVPVRESTESSPDDVRPETSSQSLTLHSLDCSDPQLFAYLRPTFAATVGPIDL